MSGIETGLTNTDNDNAIIKRINEMDTSMIVRMENLIYQIKKLDRGLKSALRTVEMRVETIDLKMESNGIQEKTSYRYTARKLISFNILAFKTALYISFGLVVLVAFALLVKSIIK